MPRINSRIDQQLAQLNHLLFQLIQMLLYFFLLCHVSPLLTLYFEQGGESSICSSKTFFKQIAVYCEKTELKIKIPFYTRGVNQ